MDKTTKKLQTLVKKRKTPIVVTKRGSLKPNKNYSNNDSVESYCYTSYNN